MSSYLWQLEDQRNLEVEGLGLSYCGELNRFCHVPERYFSEKHIEQSLIKVLYLALHYWNAIRPFEKVACFQGDSKLTRITLKFLREEGFVDAGCEVQVVKRLEDCSPTEFKSVLLVGLGSEYREQMGQLIQMGWDERNLILLEHLLALSVNGFEDNFILKIVTELLEYFKRKGTFWLVDFSQDRHAVFLIEVLSRLLIRECKGWEISMGGGLGGKDFCGKSCEKGVEERLVLMSPLKRYSHALQIEGLAYGWTSRHYVLPYFPSGVHSYDQLKNPEPVVVVTVPNTASKRFSYVVTKMAEVLGRPLSSDYQSKLGGRGYHEQVGLFPSDTKLLESSRFMKQLFCHYGKLHAERVKRMRRHEWMMCHDICDLREIFKLPFKCIVTMRDPRDVITAILFKMVPEEEFSVAGMKMFEGKPFLEGQPLLQLYLHRLGEMFLQALEMVGDHVRVVKFENVHREPEKTYREALQWMGWFPDAFTEDEVVNQELAQRIQESLPENYKKLVKKHAVRRGVIGDWKNWWSDEMKGAYKEQTGDLLIRLGYEENDEW